MSRPKPLSASRRGAWVINASKHLLRFHVAHIGLDALENILFAGKCGSLLVKLSGDQAEGLNFAKVRKHARLCGIGAKELQAHLEALKGQACIDWNAGGTEFQVLAFSRDRVLVTTTQLFELAPPTPLERVLPDVLEYCLLRPRLESELREYLNDVLTEADVTQLLALLQSFELLGVNDIEGSVGRLFFNGHQFGDRSRDIGKALSTLPRAARSELDSLVEAVAKTPGLPPDQIKASPEIKKLAVGLGIVEESTVASPAGNATFLTSPRLAPPSVGKETEHLEDDVFHHAKMLLSSLRFGELRSSSGRGRIMSPDVLVTALLERDRVGPCTAIGQDYVLLEGEGVIRTTRASHKPGEQFYMELRRREPARIVKSLLESNDTALMDSKWTTSALELPSGYSGPETARASAIAQTPARDAETMRRFLEELRT
jgi:hypothetical protein